MRTPNKDSQYLDRLRDYYADNRRIPSFQRIAELMGFSSRTASDRLLERLESAGYMERAPDDGAWIPAGRFFERPLVNASVRAGTPDVIDGTGAEPFLVDNYLVRDPSSTVMVPVKGDSMIDAGIHDGDIIAVERNKAAKPGDFVVAIVDNEFTLKELGVERGRFILKPHNPSYAVIRPKGELEVLASWSGWCDVTPVRNAPWIATHHREHAPSRLAAFSLRHPAFRCRVARYWRSRCRPGFPPLRPTISRSDSVSMSI